MMLSRKWNSGYIGHGCEGGVGGMREGPAPAVCDGGGGCTITGTGGL